MLIRGDELAGPEIRSLLSEQLHSMHEISPPESVHALQMRLPVADLESAIPFYQAVLGFRVEARHDAPVKSAVLSRDQGRIGLEENGGDPTQDGCTFHVRDLPALVAEFAANGLQQSGAAVGTEHSDGVAWRVCFVVAPDGLCYWFGERATT